MLLRLHVLVVCFGYSMLRWCCLCCVVLCSAVLCCAVLVEWLLLKSCCVEICGILFVMYGSSVVSSVFAIPERCEMVLYNVHVFVGFWNWYDDC